MNTISIEPLARYSAFTSAINKRSLVFFLAALGSMSVTSPGPAQDVHEDNFEIIRRILQRPVPPADPVDIPDNLFTYNDHAAIDTGGNPTVPLEDLQPVWNVSVASDIARFVGIGIDIVVHNGRRAYPIGRSDEISDYFFNGGPAPDATAPVVGANLSDPNLRPPTPPSSPFWADGLPSLFPPVQDFGPAGAAESGANAVIWPYGEDSNPPTAIGLITETSYSNVAHLGDSVPPRPSPTPSGVGTTYTSFGAVAIARDYAAFIANGQAFTGVYTRKFSDGVIRAAVEGLGFGHPYGNMNEVFFHGNTGVIFRSDNGIYRGHSEGTTKPVPIIFEWPAVRTRQDLSLRHVD